MERPMIWGAPVHDELAPLAHLLGYRWETGGRPAGQPEYYVVVSGDTAIPGVPNRIALHWDVAKDAMPGLNLGDHQQPPDTQGLAEERARIARGIASAGPEEEAPSFFGELLDSAGERWSEVREAVPVLPALGGLAVLGLIAVAVVVLVATR